MSTLYATLSDPSRSRELLRELLRGGVSPDDVSLLAPSDGQSEIGGLTEAAGTAGDATVFVGRDDDPTTDQLVREDNSIDEFTSIEMSRISPIDTSDIATDVESVDQMDDSQAEAEDMIYPKRGISQGTHELDDLALTVRTGFPSTIPLIDDVQPGDLAQGDQMDEGLDEIFVPGFGRIAGGGGLATAALEFGREDGEADRESLTKFLLDDGLPDDEARSLEAAFRDGKAIFAVVITPGVLDEVAVEEIVERHGADNRGLFDAPRY